jgi:hypothetical protein
MEKPALVGDGTEENQTMRYWDNEVEIKGNIRGLF